MGRGGGGGSRGFGSGGGRASGGRIGSSGRSFSGSGGWSGGGFYGGFFGYGSSGGGSSFGLGYDARTNPMTTEEDIRQNVIVNSCFLLIIAALLLIYATIWPNWFGTHKSTWQREKLSDKVIVSAEYLTNESSYDFSGKIVEYGMAIFHRQTGVNPYLLMVNKVGREGLKEFAETQYDALFDDEEHMLLVVVPMGSRYDAAIVTGNAASTVIDEEAEKIVLSYLHDCWNDEGLTDSSVFSKTFELAAWRIMNKTDTSWLIIFALVLGLGGTLVNLLIGRSQIKIIRNRG